MIQRIRFITSDDDDPVMFCVYLIFFLFTISGILDVVRGGVNDYLTNFYFLSDIKLLRGIAQNKCFLQGKYV